MKKILNICLVLLAIGGSAFVGARLFAGNPWDDGNAGPFLSLYGGGKFRDGSAVVLGVTSRSVVPVAINAYPMVNVTVGDCVTLCTFTANTFNRVSITETTTVGDTAFLGIALATVGAGTVVPIAVDGECYATLAPTNAAATPGTLLVTSSTAGKLTPSAAISTPTNYTPLSITAFGARALDSFATTGGLGVISVKKF